MVGYKAGLLPLEGLPVHADMFQVIKVLILVWKRRVFISCFSRRRWDILWAFPGKEESLVLML
jgi:hypothetical protein